VIKAGGPDDRRELNRMVKFPRAETDDTAIRVEGNKEVVDKIIAAMEAIVQERDSSVSESLDVPQDKHRVLIGRGGETRKNLESQFGVTIDIPKQGSSRTDVKLSGQPENVEKAKEHILGLVKDQGGETVEVPRRIHHAISDNGQFFRRLRNEHKVTVDHAGHQPPPKASGDSSARSRVNGGSLPLITDDTADSPFPSWEIVENNAAETPETEGMIPWVLRGPSTASISAARSALDAAIKRAEMQSCTGYLILPDPGTYRFVIGTGGSTINGIRESCGVKIDVPKNKGSTGTGEAIVIMGSRDGVEDAKERILEVVAGKGK
jgi:predicted PilT family ATPase